MTAAPACIFEDAQIAQLAPFSVTRPVIELTLGASTILQKYIKRFGAQALSLVVRPTLVELTKQQFPGLPVNHPNLGGGMWFFNSRAWLSNAAWTTLSKLPLTDTLGFVAQDQVAAAYVRQDHIEEFWQLLLNFTPQHELRNQLATWGNVQELLGATMITTPWDLVAMNPGCLQDELPHLPLLGVIKGKLGILTSVLGEPYLHVGKDAEVEDFCFIDAQKGPVYLSDGVVVESGSRLEGPLFVGPNSRIMGGKISRSSIGACSKVSGEVSESIFGSYSNKAHYGYVGDSYIGSWVNLGAGTITSNLKNTYGKVQIQSQNGEKVGTGLQFLGSLIGDHAKTGIGTLLNTGTIVGYGSNLIANTVHKGWIPPFSWGESGHYEPFRLSRFIQMATAMMSRRQLECRDVEQQVMAAYHAEVSAV